MAGEWTTTGKYKYDKCTEKHQRSAFNARQADLCKSEPQKRERTMTRSLSTPSQADYLPWTRWSKPDGSASTYIYEKCCQTSKQFLWQDTKSCGQKCISGVFAPCKGQETDKDYTFASCTETDTRPMFTKKNSVCVLEVQKRQRIDLFAFGPYSGSPTATAKCVEKQTREWYPNHYGYWEKGGCAGTKVSEARSRTSGKSGTGEFSAWKPTTATNTKATFPVCINLDPQDVNNVRTETRQYWQSLLLISDSDNKHSQTTGCVSEIQKRQKVDSVVPTAPKHRKEWSAWFGSYNFPTCLHVETRVRWNRDDSDPTREAEPCVSETQTRSSRDGEAFPPWSGRYKSIKCTQVETVDRWKEPLIKDSKTKKCKTNKSRRIRVNGGPWQAWQADGSQEQYFFSQCVELQTRDRYFEFVTKSKCAKELQYRETINGGNWSAWTGTFAYKSCKEETGTVYAETRRRYRDLAVTAPNFCISETQGRWTKDAKKQQWNQPYPSAPEDYSYDTCTLTEERVMWENPIPKCAQSNMVNASTVSASSFFSVQTDPDNVKDGSSKTFWHSGSGDTVNQLTVKLSRRYVVHHVKLVGVGAAVAFGEVQIERSLDGKSWTHVRTSNPSGFVCSAYRSDVLVGWPEYTQFVRFTLRKPCGTYFALSSVEIYNDCSVRQTGATCKLQKQVRTQTFSGNGKPTVSKWTAVDGSKVLYTHRNCTETESQFRFPNAAGKTCTGRYRTRSKVRVTDKPVPYSFWDGEGEQSDTCTANGHPLAAFVYAQCQQIETRIRYETALPTTGQCVTQQQWRMRTHSGESNVSPWTAWEAKVDKTGGNLFKSDMYTFSGCLTENAIKTMISDIQAGAGSMTKAGFCRSVATIRSTIGDFAGMALPWQLGCRIVGVHKAKARACADADGLIKVLMHHSEDVVYRSSCACDLVKLASSLISGLSRAVDPADSASLEAVSDIMEYLHFTMSQIPLRVADGMIVDVKAEAFKCKAPLVEVVAFKTRIGNPQYLGEIIGLNNVKFKACATTAKTCHIGDVIASRISYMQLPLAPRSCSNLLGCTNPSLASVVGDSNKVDPGGTGGMDKQLRLASNVALYDLRTERVINTGGSNSGGDDLKFRVDGAVNYRVALAQGTKYSPGTIVDCRHWSRNVSNPTSEYKWASFECAPLRVLNNEVECQCKTGSPFGLVASGAVVQVESRCKQKKSCEECRADDNCGWCNENKQCVEGNSNGPFDRAKCSGWVQGKCPVESLSIDNNQIVEFTKSKTTVAHITLIDPDGPPNNNHQAML
jgi:hypothetical protein